MKEPPARIVRMFIFAWNRMICKDVSTTQQSWIPLWTFSFLQNKRSVLIEKILLFRIKEWGQHCSYFAFYPLLGPIASSWARLFPLLRSTECCCTCYVRPSFQQLGATVSSQPSARPWLWSFLFSESKNEFSISLALHYTIDLEPQFLPNQMPSLPTPAGLWLEQVCREHLVRWHVFSYLKSYSVTPFTLWSVQVCHPEVRHLLLLPNIQVQDRQPGLQVDRAAEATTFGWIGWSRPWVHVRCLQMEMFFSSFKKVNFFSLF